MLITDMVTKGLKIVLIIAGFAAIVFAFLCFTQYTGTWVRSASYGGDAYTGIQNAAADTAENVKRLAIVVNNGISALLLVIGVTLSGIGFALPAKKNT